MSETNRIEYKQELNDNLDIEKEVIAFLNYHEGGIVYFGIDKIGSVIGINDLDGNILKFKERIVHPVCTALISAFWITKFSNNFNFTG